MVPHESPGRVLARVIGKTQMDVWVKKVVSHDVLQGWYCFVREQCQGAITRRPENPASLLHILLHALGPHLVCMFTCSYVSLPFSSYS